MTDPSPYQATFFTMRTALLPFAELVAWSEGLAAPAAREDDLAAALCADRARLRAGLAAVVARPEVLDALFVASPDLYDALGAWHRDPESRKGGRAEKALVRYFLRMAGRATPFGLFSGSTLGSLGETTRLEIAGRETFRRHSRLDIDYLATLARDLERDPALRAALLYRPNSSLYRAAGRLRYAEARLKELTRRYHLVAVEPTPYLEATLERAAAGARRADLAAALVADDPDGEVTLADAEEYVDSLIDTQILVSDLSPLVTGREPVPDLLAVLSPHAAAASTVERLARAHHALEDLDQGGVGVDPRGYLAIAADLAELPTEVRLPRLFQIDMTKPGSRPVLGADVVRDLLRGVELLRRLTPPPENDPVERFRQRFVERYGAGCLVPLAEALDEEVGIGFDWADGAEAEPSTLLDGIWPPEEPTDPAMPWGARHDLLVRRVQETVAAGSLEIELSDQEIEQMSHRKAPALPGAFLVMAVLAAPSQEALDRGELRLLFHNASGPSGARLLGRFCHIDEELRREVEAHLRAEEELDPEAVYAEIAHLPEGRVGNVLCRPVLRGYEIPYLGRSGAPEERQIPLSDLQVTAVDDRVVLWSGRLQRRVVPRLTTAHAYGWASLRTYRFLGALQQHGRVQFITWSWGVLRSTPFLPRVRSGRLVLCRARWLASAKELADLGAAAGAARFHAVREWRARRRLPRWIVLADGDNELPVDLDNALAVDAFVDLVRRRKSAELLELFPPPGELCARGPEGGLVHDLLVPFVRTPEPAMAAGASPVPPRPAMPVPAVRRSFPPGSEWLYVKLYTGTATADRLLRDLVAPVRAWALASGVSDGWFFIRYGDPYRHLRVRFHGRPDRLNGELLPRLTRAAETLLADGWLWKLQLDTYDREVERYGGPAGIEVAERIFEADSECALGILELSAGDAAADLRWRLALAGLDRLLADLGLDQDGRLALVRRFRERSDYAHALGRRYRVERPRLEPLLGQADGLPPEVAAGLAVLRRRSAAVVPHMDELRRRATEGRLTQTLDSLALSFLHMHVNRLIRGAANEHERVLYDFLGRLYESQAARGSGAEVQ